jgi:murein DD-endopeptidase MepM/ murein hydrolase activator NlpD
MAEESALGLVAKLNQELDKVNSKAERLNSLLAGGTGTGSTGTSGGSMMPGSLASISAAGTRMARMEMGAGIVRGVTTMAGGVVSMLPDVGEVVARAGGYYGATVRAGGGMSRKVLESVTFGGLGGGLSYRGVDADIAAYAGAVGLNPNSPLYRQLLAGAGNATKYLNMDTMAAFSAMEQMTAGPGSGNLMARYGIFTSDPRTGQVRSQTAIFEELAQRMTAGQPRATEAQILEDLRRGPLGSNIRNSGMSADQQYMFSQYMIERARGRQLDLSDPNAMKQMMAEAEAQGNANPFAAAYRISSAQTGAMSKAEDNYLKAITDATPAIEAMNAAAGEFATSIVGYTSALTQSLLGDRATGGGLQAVTGLAQTAAATYLGAKAIGAIGKGGNATKAMSATSATSAAKAVKGLGVAGGIIGTGASAIEGYQKGQQGVALTPMDFISAGLSGALAGGSIGAFSANPLGIAAGAVIGSITSMGALAISNAAGTGGASDSYGQAGFGSGSISSPLSGGTITSSYGAQRSDGSIHKGVDIAMPEGTPVYAVAAGKVVRSQTGSGDRSYGEYVEIQHSSEYTTLYAHLKTNSRRVRVGDTVSAGQQIGEVGSTGLSTGPHLHFEVRKNGVKINPESVLPEDLLGSGKVIGKQESTTPNSKPQASLLQLATKPQGGPNSGFTSLSVSVSGVRGTLLSAAQVVASGVGTSLNGLSAPATTALGTDSVEPGVKSGTGGSENYLPLAGSTSGVMNSRNLSATKTVSSAGVSSAAPNVNINVTVAQASPAEAKRLAELVKSYLEDDAMTMSMGRR